MRKNVYLFAGSDPLFDLSNGKGNLGVGEHLAHFKRGLGLISVDPCAVAFFRRVGIRSSSVFLLECVLFSHSIIKLVLSIFL